jgi:hypothetical protein
MAKVTPSYNLPVIHPALAGQRHPTRNDPITPLYMAPSSSKRVWWLCSKGHEWIAAVSNRANGSRCPYWSDNKVCDDNCLETLAPHIAKEWHPQKNGDLTPRDLTCGSSKKVWWLCPERHKWQATIVIRTVAGNLCPVCNRGGRSRRLKIEN